MEEIYALAREAFSGGQKAFHVHAFPFRMTAENIARYKGHKNSRFWRSLKEGYDYFEVSRQVPNVEICARRYHVNVERVGGSQRHLNARGACPRFRKGPIVPFGSAVASNASSISPPTANTTNWSTKPAVRYHNPRDPIAGLLRK